MRIKLKNKIKEGDTRIKTCFLFFPRQFDNELIWLEKVTIKQEAKRFVDMITGHSEILWVDIELLK